jgi:3-dehydroquinate dehydratase-2
MKQRIIIINGPNLNLLGKREESQYGDVSYSDLEKKCAEYANNKDIKLTFKQSNIEGEIVSMIQEAVSDFDGLIINAGGYTHTSVSIHDALLILKIPSIELHISNIYTREEFRQKSLISKAVSGIICGLGTDGYTISIDAIIKLIKNK